MKNLSRKNKYILGGAALAVILVLLTLLVVALIPKGDDPYSKPAAVENSESDKNTPEKTPDEPSEEDTPSDSTPTTTLDPATVGTIDVQPLSLTVSYVKGIGGFEYGVQRSTGGTQYVEFTSPQLAGTKCTDDAGAFASIIKDPSANEASTVTSSQTVDGVKYGLSLSDDTCTGNKELLKQYQASFRDAFSLLKKMS